MAHLKSFITRYSKVYIGLVLLIWLSFFFIPWDRAILGVRIDIFIIQESLASFWNSVHFDGLAVQESQSLCFWTDLLSFSLD
ncbi:SpeK [Streptococcus pneumoniae]|nr:SpeK [Streptococcus pneumoniae]